MDSQSDTAKVKISTAGVVRADEAADKGEGEGEGEDAMNPIVKQQDAANIVWAAEAAEVGRTGDRGWRARNVEVRRSRKYHVGNSARRRYQELAKLSVVENSRHEERSTL
ncbi:hypothetical protein FACUT_12666 [Fusarium acutatum]|uniref:Uncharacterized protein n=1 Tax=Fusarium acutatum TaxID=78861 RepID=A0A8H4JDB1_9HYPO|nr:hypothetical protein FACUT_12666 [Fusarium acutatum]